MGQPSWASAGRGQAPCFSAWLRVPLTAAGAQPYGTLRWTWRPAAPSRGAGRLSSFRVYKAQREEEARVRAGVPWPRQSCVHAAAAAPLSRASSGRRWAWRSTDAAPVSPDFGTRPPERGCPRRGLTALGFAPRSSSGARTPRRRGVKRDARSTTQEERGLSLVPTCPVQTPETDDLCCGKEKKKRRARPCFYDS